MMWTIAVIRRGHALEATINSPLLAAARRIES